MQWKTFNKASASMLAGALVTLATVFVELDQTMQAAAQTVITSLLVYFIANQTETL